MSLFNKEKGIVFCFLNAVLLIWVIAAVVILISDITQLVLKEPRYKYDEYRLVYCDFEYDTEKDCEAQYISYNHDEEYHILGYKRSSVTSIANAVIVSGVLYILNRNKKVK